MDFEPSRDESLEQAFASQRLGHPRPRPIRQTRFLAAPYEIECLCESPHLKPSTARGLGDMAYSSGAGPQMPGASRSMEPEYPNIVPGYAVPAPGQTVGEQTSHGSTKPLKLMHVGPCFLSGGVEQHTLSLVKFLDPRRIDFVKCLVTNPNQLSAESAGWMPVPVEYCAPADVHRAVAECDVVLVWGDGFNEILKLGRPRLSVFVAHGESWWTRQTVEQSSQVIDHVIAVSQRVQERVCAGVPATTILNGVDAARLGQTRSREAVRAGLGFAPTDFVLGSVGRFSNEKRMPLLIDAVSRLPSQFKLLLVGHGARRHALLDLANELIPGRYAFAAADNYLGDHYRAMDAFALVSQHEGFGLVIPEAMLCERPVIATNVGCVPEIIRDRVNGLVVDPTPAAIANAARMLQQHPEWAKGLAAEGRAVADARLHAARMAREYEDLLWRLWRAKTTSTVGAES